MRRIGGLWDEVTSFENLCRAARRAARAKRGQAGVAAFLERLEPEALRLQRELASGAWRPGRPTTFTITDPKQREITAAPFADRVVHHGLVDVLEPHLDRRMIFESFACRRGKGTHAAVRHAQAQVRRHAFFLKMDVRHFFASLRHDVVMETIHRVVKGRSVLALCERIVRGAPGARTSVGLPIGNLTSQWFANLVLDSLDHHVKEVLRMPGYVRYMDDFVLFAGDKARLRDAATEVAGYLADPLGLVPKAGATILAPAWRGLPFLGWQVFPGTLRLRPANLARMRRRLRRRAWEVRTGRIGASTYRAAAQSAAAHLSQGGTLGLRRDLFTFSRGGRALFGADWIAPATA